MKHIALCLLALILLVIAGTGCQSPQASTPGLTSISKSQGVYTTLAITNEDLDFSGSGYFQKSSFGPNETPAAVIIGYGEYNNPRQLSLDLVESATGRVLLSKDVYANYGKVEILN